MQQAWCANKLHNELSKKLIGFKHFYNKKKQAAIIENIINTLLTVLPGTFKSQIFPSGILNQGRYFNKRYAINSSERERNLKIVW